MRAGRESTFTLIVIVLFGVAAFFLTHLPAAAAAGAVCAGKDLLPELKANQPELYEEVSKEADATANGESLLWRVQGRNGNSVSFLLGTFHLADPRIAKLDETLKDIIGKVDTIALEITGIGDKAAIQKELAAHPELIVMPGGKDAWISLSETEKTIVAEAVESVGLPAEQASRLQPWLPATMLGVSSCFTKLGVQGKAGLDQVLEDYGNAQGKTLTGLETPAEQFKAMSSIPMESQLQFLKDSAFQRGKIDDLHETLIQMFLQRQIAWALPFSKTVTAGERTQKVKKAQADFIKSLLTDRNIKMADRAVSLLNAGPALIAVGALHLPGKFGLVTLLRQQGFEIKPVNW